MSARAKRSQLPLGVTLFLLWPLSCAGAREDPSAAAGGTPSFSETGGVPSHGTGGGSVSSGSGSAAQSGGVSGNGGTATGGDVTAGATGGMGGASSGGTSGGGANTGGQNTGGQNTGSGDAGSSSTGGDPSSGGTRAGTGGARPDADLDPLLAEFVAYWDFEAIEGQIVRPVIGDVSLQLNGTSMAAGPSGSQLEVVGAGSWAVTAGPVLDTEHDFSVSAWVRLDELDGYDTFVGMDGAAVSAFQLQKRDDDRLAFTTFPTDSTSASSCAATAEIRPREQEWYHLVGTWNAAAGDQRIYVDGVLSGRTTCSGGVLRASGPLSAGRGWFDGEASDPWTGAVDDLGLIDRVLTPGEVVTLYRGGRPNQSNYLFAYFVEVTNGRGDGLRLAHSHDGRHWGAIGAGKVFMPPSVGGGSFRDPHVMRAPDGRYHLVWTTSCVPWAEANCVQDRGLGHASSLDLVTWSEADYVTIDSNVEHVWAPETFYDETTDQFMIFWSSPIDETSASDPHSIYYVLTRDFTNFSDVDVLYAQPGRNFIDATILARGDSYLMIIKDEADGQKNLRALASTQLFGAGAWTAAPSPPITGSYAAEGPSFLERDGHVYVYFDKYWDGAYGALEATTSALDTPMGWRDISDSVFFPGVRHGTAIEVPPNVFRAVAEEAGR